MIKSLRLGLWIYNIVERDDVFVEKDFCYGSVIHEPPTITIERGIADHKVAHTILHEVIHAYDYQYGMGLEEDQVRGLATAMCDFIQHNKDFMKLI